MFRASNAVLCLGMGLSLAFAGGASAGIVAITGLPSSTMATLTTPASNSVQGTVDGFGFTANSSGTAKVNELGFWVPSADSGGTGVTAVDHTVALMEFNGGSYTEIAEATIAAGSSADASGYAWVSIPTVTLTDTSQVGDQYVVWATMGTDLWGPASPGVSGLADTDTAIGTLTGHGGFTSQSLPGVGNTVGISFDSATSSSNYANGGFAGPNLGYLAPSATPEPSSLSLIGIGAIALLGWRRRATR